MGLIVPADRTFNRVAVGLPPPISLSNYLIGGAAEGRPEPNTKSRTTSTLRLFSRLLNLTSTNRTPLLILWW
jgi:hypothetical protein